MVRKDGGWSWAVLLSCFIFYVSIGLKVQLFSLVYQDILVSSETSSTTTYWIFNTFQFMMDVSSLFTGPLCDRYGYRSVAFVCGLAIGSSSLISASVKIPEFLFVTYSLFAGIAAGLLFTIGQLVLPFYFDKRLGFSVGIVCSGMPVGHFIGPILVSVLQEEYGKYSYIILSAIYFNLCAAAITLTANRKKIKQITPVAENKIENAKNEEICKVSQEIYELENNAQNSNDIPVKETSAEVAPEPNSHESNLENMGIIRTAFHNMKVLRYYRSHIIIISILLLYIVQTNFVMTVPFALLSAGHPMELVTWGLSISALFNIISRILILSLSDYIDISKKWYIMAGSLGTGLSLVAFTAASSPSTILASLAAYGITIGSTTSFQSILIIEFMGINLLPATFGANGFIMSISFLTLAPIIGVIRDYSASYDVTILFMSSFSFVAFLLWCLMPLALRIDSRKQNNNIHKNRT